MHTEYALTVEVLNTQQPPEGVTACQTRQNKQLSIIHISKEHKTYWFWCFKFHLEINMEKSEHKMMLRCQKSRQTDFNFIMVRSHSCSNSNLCMAPLL